ncbi:MAG: rhodanese-like domain-containing protein [Desulfobacteraceae bacterium]|nr:MAG: rhodanese-like domain-containing protein [Desulfobacteraceae bacterium]
MRGKKSIVPAVAAVLIIAVALWLTGRAVTPMDSTWDDVLAEAKAGGYRIMSTEELAGEYQKDADNMLLIDTRQEWEYRTGHIKGALNFPMEPTWWSRWRKASALETLLGPVKDRSVVFY